MHPPSVAAATLRRGRRDHRMHCRELLQKATKETKAVVDLKKPSLPSFSSVEFLVRLRLVFFRVVSCLPAVVCEGWIFRGAASLPGTEPNSQKATPNAFAIFCLKSFDEDSAIVKKLFCVVSRLPAVVCEGWVFRGQRLSLGRNQFHRRQRRTPSLSSV